MKALTLILATCAVVALLAPAAGAGNVVAGPRIIAGQVHGVWGIVPNGSVVVVQMRTSGLPHGSTLSIRCLRGCKVREELSAPKSGVVRSRALAHRLTLPRGAVLELKATKLDFVGWYAELTVLGNPKTLAVFREKQRCLTPSPPHRPVACARFESGKAGGKKAAGKTAAKPRPRVSTIFAGGAASAPAGSAPSPSTPAPATAAGSTSAATPQPPAAPGSPTFGSISGTGFTASWSAVQGATGYHLFLNGTAVGTTTATSYAFGGLDCGTGYAVAVDAYNDAGASSRVSATGSTSVCKPAAPSPSVGSIGAGGFTVSWPAVGGATGYHVFLNGASAGQATTGTSFPINGLAACRDYTVAVDAYNAGGTSTQGTATATTAGCKPASPSPSIASQTRTSLTVSWGAVAGAIGYHVAVDGTSVGGPVTDTTYTVGSLDCGTTHTIQVDAYNSAGSSPQASVTGSTFRCLIVLPPIPRPPILDPLPPIERVLQ
jgi:Fibronectin type III domain